MYNPAIQLLVFSVRVDKYLFTLLRKHMALVTVVASEMEGESEETYFSLNPFCTFVILYHVQD